MALIFLVLFIVLPIAEIYVIVKIGEAIGILPTLALLILDGFLGAALLRSQGGRAWERFNRALAEGRVPTREVFDGAMIILGGALLLTPGFITDVFGLVLLIPPTRALIRRGMGALARRRLSVGWRVAGFGEARPPRPGPPPRPGAPPRPGPAPGTRPGYDYEGTAREIDDLELPERSTDGSD